jgi:hypothetical protein
MEMPWIIMPGGYRVTQRGWTCFFHTASVPVYRLAVFPGVNHIFLPDPDGHPKNYGNWKSFEVGQEVLQLLYNGFFSIPPGSSMVL